MSNNFDGVIGLGVVGALGYGLYRFIKWIDKTEEEKAEERKRFTVYKETYIKTMDIDKLRMDATLLNNNLPQADRTFVYDFSTSYITLIDCSLSEDELKKRVNDFLDFYNKLTNEDKTAVKAYVGYLKQLQEAKKNEQKKKESLSEKQSEYDHEENLLDRKLKAEERKAEFMVESIKAVANAGKTPVNVTVNNDN